LLSEEERQQVVRAAVEAAGDRVIAGVFGPSARAIVASTGRLREVGAQAVAVIPPPYVSLTDSEMRAHYTAVADASELPVVLYNYPGQTPSPISTDVALSLAGHPAIVATKQSRATLDEDFARLICTAPDALPVLVGNPLLMLPAATLGASGAMLALANIEAERLVALWRVVADGDWTTARSMMRDLLPVVLANRGKGPDFKQVLHERGLIRSPERRLPLGGAVAGAACATAGLG
jgi:4-hydroxy-tetrahydrodipicolinate synthase